MALWDKFSLVCIQLAFNHMFSFRKIKGIGTLVACRAQVIRADTQPISRRTLLLLMSALQDRFRRMLETTWWSSSLSEAS